MTKRIVWKSERYPAAKGWTHSVHTRGPNDKLAGTIYYNYYPPSGNRKQIRSIKQVHARMESDEAAKKTHKNTTHKNSVKKVTPMEEDDEVVVVPAPKTPNPIIIDLTNADAEDDRLTDQMSLHVYGNVEISVSPGGGYHIKWKE